MPIVNGYVTQSEMKAWLGLDPEEPHDELDDLIDDVVNAVSRYFDEICLRTFYQVIEARVFDPVDRYTIALGTYNDLVSVTELATDEDGDGTYEEVWDETEYELGPAPGSASEPRPYRFVDAIGRRFPLVCIKGERKHRTRIMGTWGWPQFPDGLVQATKIQGARVLKRKEAPEGILGLNQFGVLRVAGKPDPDVMDLVRPYRLRTVG